MTNSITMMKVSARGATREDFEKARESLSRLLPRLKTPEDYQKAYTALEGKVMATWQPEARAGALVALKVAEQGGLTGR